MLHILTKSAGRRAFSEMLDGHGGPLRDRIVPSAYGDDPEGAIEDGATVVFADLERLPPTHLEQAAALCRRAIVLERGQIEWEGTASEAVSRFEAAAS